MSSGWIVLHRKIFESWVYKLSNAEQIAFLIWLISRANWKRGKMFVNGSIQIIERGEFWASLDTLAIDYSALRRKKLKKSTIRHWINMAEKAEFIARTTTQRGTLIKIENYRTYQDINNDSQHIEQHTDSTLTAHRQHTDSTDITSKQSNQKTKNNKYSPEFELFWNLYDRKNEKPKAWKQWKIVLKAEENHERILIAAKNFILAHPDKKFRVYPERFLKNEDMSDWQSERKDLNSDKKTGRTFEAGSGKSGKFDGIPTEIVNND